MLLSKLDTSLLFPFGALQRVKRPTAKGKGERASVACSGHRLQSFQSLYWTRVLVTCSSLQSQLTSHPGSILSSCPNLGLCSWPPTLAMPSASLSLSPGMWEGSWHPPPPSASTRMPHIWKSHPPSLCPFLFPWPLTLQVHGTITAGCQFFSVRCDHSGDGNSE